MKKNKPPYLYEPILLSEVILFNNLKKLKENPDLYNDEYLEELENLRDKSVQLEQSREKGLQQQKREIRDKIRDLSYKTYVYRDTNLFGKMIDTMANRILTRPQFSGYTIKDEMKSLGIEYVLKYIYNFDPYKTSKISNQPVSAFAYISTIIFNGIIQVINSFNKEQEKIRESILEYQNQYNRYGGYDDNFNDLKIKTPIEYENIKYKDIIITQSDLENSSLLKIMKKYTIHEPTRFIIPEDYKITENDLKYIQKYIIGIKRREING